MKKLGHFSWLTSVLFIIFAAFLWYFWPIPQKTVTPANPGFSITVDTPDSNWVLHEYFCVSADECLLQNVEGWGFQEILLDQTPLWSTYKFIKVYVSVGDNMLMVVDAGEISGTKVESDVVLIPLQQPFKKFYKSVTFSSQTL